jgi:hypothetical protein
VPITIGGGGTRRTPALAARHAGRRADAVLGQLS